MFTVKTDFENSNTAMKGVEMTRMAIRVSQNSTTRIAFDFGVLLATSTSLVGCAPRGGAIMSFDDYAKIEHDVPYILDCEQNGAQLLYYGAAHCFDPTDPQMADIEQRWNAMKPTLGLNEGGNPPVAPTRDEAIRLYGEAGLLRWLGQRDNVPVRTFEPSPAAEAEELLREFTVEQVKTFYIMRALGQNAAKPEKARTPNLEEITRNVLLWYSQVYGLEGSPRTHDEFVASCSRLAPELKDWREPPMSWFDPAPRRDQPTRWTNRVARRASEFRDRFLVERLCDALEPDARVFAAIGASHVVMQEPALRARLAHVARSTSTLTPTNR